MRNLETQLEAHVVKGPLEVSATSNLKLSDAPDLSSPKERQEHMEALLKQMATADERHVNQPDTSEKTEQPAIQEEKTHESKEFTQTDIPDTPEGRLDAMIRLLEKAAVSSNENSAPKRDGAERNEYYSNYKDRLDQTPSDTGERGTWTGDRGESKYIPNNAEIAEILKKYGWDGIVYKDGIPDFSGCSECTVEIDNMTEKRIGPGGNFEQCDQKCAEQWNKEGRDGKTDWTARDVANWRTTHGYSWHERNDMKTCDLIPTKVNDYFGHLGGVGECRRRDSQTNPGGEFDDE